MLEFAHNVYILNADLIPENFAAVQTTGRPIKRLCI